MFDTPKLTNIMMINRSTGGIKLINLIQSHECMYVTKESQTCIHAFLHRSNTDLTMMYKPISNQSTSLLGMHEIRIVKNQIWIKVLQF